MVRAGVSWSAQADHPRPPQNREPRVSVEKPENCDRMRRKQGSGRGPQTVTISKGIRNLAAAMLACATAAPALASASGIELTIEAAPVMQPVLAPATPRPMILAETGGLRLDLRLDTLEDEALAYVADRQDDIFRIKPDNRRLVAAWKEGGSIVASPVPFATITTVALNIGYRNTLAVPAVITAARLEVESSLVDTQPLLQLSYGGSGYRGLGTNFTMDNYGWGEPIEGRVQYGFVNPGAPADVTRGTTVNVSQSLPEKPGASWSVNVRSGLARMGVDMNQFERWAASRCTSATVPGIQCSGSGDQACVAALKRDGLLGSLGEAARMKDGVLTTDIIGMVVYKWKDSEGTTRSASGPFRQTIGLGQRQISCPVVGQPAPPLPPPPPPPPEVSPDTPIPVDLVMGGRGYVVDLPVARTLPAGASGTTRLLIRADKSSATRLRVVVQVNDASVQSQPVDMLAFVARR